jgi:hypothetical protein
MNAPLDHARAISNALLAQPAPAIPGLEVTELPDAEAQLQWRLAVALQSRDPARDFQITVPAWLAD